MSALFFHCRALAVWVLASVLAACACGGSQAQAAESFRIETKIFQGEVNEKEKDPKPVSTTTTLFDKGIVYDFLEKPEQTAVFRKPANERPARFILLNDQEQVQTEIDTERLSAAMVKLRDWASRQQDPFLQFTASPKFEEDFNRNTGKLTLTSIIETYTVETQPTQHQESLGTYREFLDWYTQLNALLSTKTPPDPRLKLNASLARHSVLPTKIELKRDGEEPVRAEHDFTWRLSQKDLQRIDEVHNALSSYKVVENAEFLKLSEPVAKR